jgi:hypothetical protein
MNTELYKQIKKYINDHGKLIVGFYPVPIPDIDVEFDYSEKYSKLLNLLGEYWWEFAYKCDHLQGSYEFKILKDGNINVKANSYENNTWTNDNKDLFIKEILNYGFYRYLNKYYSKKFIKKLIEEEDFPESELDYNYMKDCIESFFKVKLEYNSKTGFKEFKLIINGYEIDPDSNLQSFTKRIFRKSIARLDLSSQNLLVRMFTTKLNQKSDFGINPSVFAC